MRREEPGAGGPDAQEVAQIEPLMVSARDAARLLGVSQETFERRVRMGEIPGATWGGRHRRWAVCDLRAWVAAGSPRADDWDAMRRRGRAGLAS